MIHVYMLYIPWYVFYKPGFWNLPGLSLPSDVNVECAVLKLCWAVLASLSIALERLPDEHIEGVAGSWHGPSVA